VRIRSGARGVKANEGRAVFDQTQAVAVGVPEISPIVVEQGGKLCCDPTTKVATRIFRHR